MQYDIIKKRRECDYINIYIVIYHFTGIIHITSDGKLH